MAFNKKALFVILICTVPASHSFNKEDVNQKLAEAKEFAIKHKRKIKICLGIALFLALEDYGIYRTDRAISEQKKSIEIVKSLNENLAPAYRIDEPSAPKEISEMRKIVTGSLIGVAALFYDASIKLSRFCADVDERLVLLAAFLALESYGIYKMNEIEKQDETIKYSLIRKLLSSPIFAFAHAVKKYGYEKTAQNILKCEELSANKISDVSAKITTQNIGVALNSGLEKIKQTPTIIMDFAKMLALEAQSAATSGAQAASYYANAGLDKINCLISKKTKMALNN